MKMKNKKRVRIFVGCVLYLLIVPWMLGLLGFDGINAPAVPDYLATHTTLEFLAAWYFGGLIAVLMMFPMAWFLIYFFVSNEYDD